MTYGLVGNDAIGSSDDRFYYLSEVNPNDGGRGQYFGTNYGNQMNGVSISRYPNTNITWEKSKKGNFGIELGMFNSALEVQVTSSMNVVLKFTKTAPTFLLQWDFLPE